jgi:hypothetical protein
MIMVDTISPTMKIMADRISLATLVYGLSVFKIETARIAIGITEEKA